VSVLSAALIRDRVSKGEIFHARSYDPRHQLWAGKYNLRMAADGLIFPSGEDRSFKKIWPNDSAKLDRDGFVLEPGETAFISTHERFCMPWDLSAIVGPKFTLARHGLLVLTGSVVDPGFGMRWDGKHWAPAPDERLHFLVANLGSGRYRLHPLDSIASLQLVELEGGIDGTPDQEVRSSDELYEEFFRGDAMESAGLAFIRSLEQTRQEVATMKGAVDALQLKVDTLENSTNQLIYFGVFLLGVTLLAACVTLGVGFWSKTSLNWWEALITLAIAVLVTVFAWHWVDRRAERDSTATRRGTL
jgi:deoxycytidine triphosphate deaminase